MSYLFRTAWEPEQTFEGEFVVLVRGNHLHEPRELEVKVGEQWQPAELYAATQSIANSTLREHVGRAARVMVERRAPGNTVVDSVGLANLDLLILATTMIGHLHAELPRPVDVPPGFQHPGRIIHEMIATAAKAWDRMYAKPANVVYLTREQEQWLEAYHHTDGTVQAGQSIRERFDKMFGMEIEWDAGVFNVDRR